MIEVTKKEAKVVRSFYPNACIAKTRHKRYLEESERYLTLIPGNPDAELMLARMAKEAQRRQARQARVREEV